MDMKQLLEAVTKFSGEEVGQKPGDQVRGTEKAKPTKSGQHHPFKGRLVGGGAQESVLKDLSKGPTPKTKEQELAEEYQAFLEAEFKDTAEKRPARKGARHNRGHEPQPRYKTIKADEAVGQEYTVVIDRKGREKPVTGTMEELLDYFGYTLETGKSYEHEKGRYKINLNPKNAEQLVDALNKAATNAAANSSPSTYYSVGENQLAESHYKWEITFRDGKQAVYQQNNPHYNDKTAASDIAYSVSLNPGSRVIATKDGKPFDWQSLLNEGWESGPPEYKEPYDDADDAYDRRRQEKLDIEAEKENAKRPQKKIYTLTGRGPNMEPNYKFPGEWDSQAEAIAAREKLMADPKTPHPEHIGIHSYTKYLDQTEESRGHKIISTKLKDIERAKKFAAGELKVPTPQERAAELAKQKKEKVDEYGANTSTATMGGTQQQGAMPDVSKLNPQQKQQLALQLDPQAMKKAAAATSQIKSATGSSASGPNLLKALNAASQGKAVSGQDATALKPMMDVVKKAAMDPKLATQFKALASQAKQIK